MKLTRLAKYAWGVLVLNIGVILWGAYVRATGSGAGCGSHWPLCNGEVLPRAPQIETVIEFTHRATSGLAFLLVLGLFIWIYRVYPKGHVLRLGANLSLFFIITEALVGAGLVLFEWVAYDDSIERVFSISIHLINTLLLLGALTLTAWWASGGDPIDLRGHGAITWAFALGYFGILILGASGAITALGDTLFPAETLVDGVRQDFSPTAHFLVRLRVWHPVIAVINGFYLIFVAGLVAMFRTNQLIKRLATSLIIVFVLQLAAGLVNLVLLAPIWMQILHLLLADMVWINFVLLTAVNFACGQTNHTSEVNRLPEPKINP